MGGVDRLEALHSMSAVVWIHATTRYLSGIILDVGPYVYPVSVWRFEPSLGHPWERAPYVREGSSPGYSQKVPAYELEAFYLFFEGRWQNAPADTRSLRDRSEGERWNMAHRFLGKGVHLRYSGRGTFDGRSVHSVRVDDRKFGRTFLAHFDSDSALLMAEEEGLSEREAEWFRSQKGHQGRRSSEWTTRYAAYEEIQGVLVPTRWTRTERSTRSRPPYSSTILLSIAFNGEEPSRSPPDAPSPPMGSEGSAPATHWNSRPPR